jgi:hypothetical protein
VNVSSVFSRRAARITRFRVSGQWLRVRPQQAPLERHAAGVVEWILRAQRATPDDGVAHSFDVATRRWLPSYPETTGYIICSLLRAAQAGIADRDTLHAAATGMGRWLVKVQLESGAFQGGHIGTPDPQPAVFNTGQILKGLTDLIVQNVEPSEAVKNSAFRAAEWLIGMQEPDGVWRRVVSALVTEPVGAYNVRTAWALARYGKALGHRPAIDAGIANGEWLVSAQTADGWFPHMTMHAGTSPLLHTVAYTINGLLELGDLCQRPAFVEAAARAAERVRKLQDPHTGAIPGQIEPGYRAAVPWTNTTANSQMAIVWFRLAELTGEPQWRPAALAANRFNKRLHDLDSWDEQVRGGLRGSSPCHLGYGRLSYMNWTQKFFLDALLAEMGVSIR